MILQIVITVTTASLAAALCLRLRDWNASLELSAAFAVMGIVAKYGGPVFHLRYLPVLICALGGGLIGSFIVFLAQLAKGSKGLPQWPDRAAWTALGMGVLGALFYLVAHHGAGLL